MMETFTWIIITIYLSVNCFFSGAEWANKRMSMLVILGLFFAIPITIFLFCFYFIKLLIKKKL